MPKHRLRAFLSYSSANRELADLVGTILQQEGIELARDDESIKSGERWTESIRDSIHDCDVFLILLTLNSLNSDWIAYEVGMARAWSKPIVVLHEGISPADVPEYLQSFQVSGVSQLGSVLNKLRALSNRLANS